MLDVTLYSVSDEDNELWYAATKTTGWRECWLPFAVASINLRSAALEDSYAAILKLHLQVPQDSLLDTVPVPRCDFFGVYDGHKGVCGTSRELADILRSPCRHLCFGSYSSTPAHG
jgi:hypothetical protein